MPPSEPLQARADALNAAYRHHSAIAVLARALHDPDLRQLALVSSFGAESVVLLHMVALARRDTPVIFLDTGMLFTETLVYQQELAERLRLSHPRRRHRTGGPGQHPASTRHRCLLCLAQNGAACLRIARFRRLDHWAQTLSGRHPCAVGVLRSRQRDGPTEGQPAGPLGAG